MVDLHGQYLKIKDEVDQAIQEEGVGDGLGDVAPGPCGRKQMDGENDHEGEAQGAGPPGERTADGVQSVQKNQRAAPDAKTGRKPPQ